MRFSQRIQKIRNLVSVWNRFFREMVINWNDLMVRSLKFGMESGHEIKFWLRVFSISK